MMLWFLVHRPSGCDSRRRSFTSPHTPLWHLCRSPLASFYSQIIGFDNAGFLRSPTPGPAGHNWLGLELPTSDSSFSGPSGDLEVVNWSAKQPVIERTIERAVTHEESAE